MINEKLNYNDIVKKQELTLEERYYIEGFDYGFDNIKIEYLKDLKNNITNGVDGYKTQDEIVSEEVKSATENKVNEVETTKQKIETAKTEIKAEEERKAAEEAAKGLKVGNYTIKYGKKK